MPFSHTHTKYFDSQLPQTLPPVSLWLFPLSKQWGWDSCFRSESRSHAAKAALWSWPWTYDPPTSTFWVVGLQGYTTTSDYQGWFLTNGFSFFFPILLKVRCMCLHSTDVTQMANSPTPLKMAVGVTPGLLGSKLPYSVTACYLANLAYTDSTHQMLKTQR